MTQSVTLTQLAEQGPHRIQMNSFIIQTSGGKLIAMDGGNVPDKDNLYETLRAMSEGKIRIEAWLFTHAHADHVDAFIELWREHAPEIELKSVWFHFPREDFIEKNDPDRSSLLSLQRFNRLIPELGERVHIARVGETLTVDDVCFTVLCEPDEAFPMNCMNNTSVVYRMEACGQRVLFLGDLGEEAGDRLLRDAGAQAVRADIVQMAHHGQNGVKRSFYEAVQPKACLWCTPQWLWDNDAGAGYNTHCWKTIEVRAWMDELGVKTHFVSKDGPHSIRLPLALGE